MIRIVAFLFAGGDAFFCGLAIVAGGLILAALRDSPRIRVAFRMLSLTGWIIIAASATPLPLWFYLVGVILTGLIWLPRSLNNGVPSARLRFLAFLVLVS